MEFSNCGSAFFVFLGQQPGHPDGDVDKLGSINNVHFTDILCGGPTTSANASTNQTWGSLITGQIYNGTTYDISNLFFTNCRVNFWGNHTGAVPGTPPEWDSNQYPEVAMWGDLPAYGYYLRHVNGAVFTNCSSNRINKDTRPEEATNDVTDFSTRVDSDTDGMPDDWEQQYFNSPTDASPTDDSDGDGRTNYAEFVDGTDPLDPNDHLAPTATEFDGTTVTLTFRSVALKRYVLEYRDDVMSGSWTQIGNIRAADSNTLTVTDTPGAGVLHRYYRLRTLID